MPRPVLMHCRTKKGHITMQACCTAVKQWCQVRYSALLNRKKSWISDSQTCQQHRQIGCLSAHLACQLQVCLEDSPGVNVAESCTDGNGCHCDNQLRPANISSHSIQQALLCWLHSPVMRLVLLSLATDLPKVTKNQRPKHCCTHLAFCLYTPNMLPPDMPGAPATPTAPDPSCHALCQSVATRCPNSSSACSQASASRRCAGAASDAAP